VLRERPRTNSGPACLESRLKVAENLQPLAAVQGRSWSFSPDRPVTGTHGVDGPGNAGLGISDFFLISIC
jgi:hypothetical protein